MFVGNIGNDFDPEKYGLNASLATSTSGSIPDRQNACSHTNRMCGT